MSTRYIMRRTIPVGGLALRLLLPATKPPLASSARRCQPSEYSSEDSLTKLVLGRLQADPTSSAGTIKQKQTSNVQAGRNTTSRPDVFWKRILVIMISKGPMDEPCADADRFSSLTDSWLAKDSPIICQLIQTRVLTDSFH